MERDPQVSDSDILRNLSEVTGTGELYTTDGAGNISFLRTHTGWRPSWTHIIPGNFGGRREWTDLLFYEAGT